MSFTSTNMNCGPGIEYQVTYTPASATPNLISLPTSTVPSIVFGSSINTADANIYTVTVKVRPTGSTNWLTPTGTSSFVFKYVDLCSSTILERPILMDMATSVLKQTSPGGSPFYETQAFTATTNSASENQ